MKRSHGLILTIAVLGAGVGARSLIRSAHIGDETPRAPDPARSNAVAAAGSETIEMAQMRREMLQLQNQVRALSEQLARATSAPVVQDDPQPAADRHDPRTDAERREEDERKHHEYMVGVDAAFRKEAADSRWAAATTSAVQTAIADTAELRPLARGVECRSRTCRVELSDDGSGTLARALPIFAVRLGQDLPSVDADRVEGASGGGSTMVLYLSRHSDAVVRR